MVGIRDSKVIGNASEGMLYGIRFLGIGQNDRSSSGTEGGSS